MRMKNKIYQILILVIGCGLILHSCKKDSADDNDMSDMGNTGADTIACSTITYDAHIATIFNKNCGGCHVTGSQGGVNFNNYAKLKNQLEVGKVLGSINHQPGFKVMPTSGIKLPQTVLDSIDCWVSNGYKEK